MPTECCGTCASYRDGQCRHDSPEAGADGKAVFPVIAADQWCRQWESTAEKRPAVEPIPVLGDTLKERRKSYGSILEQAAKKVVFSLNLPAAGGRRRSLDDLKDGLMDAGDPHGLRRGWDGDIPVPNDARPAVDAILKADVLAIIRSLIRSARDTVEGRAVKYYLEQMLKANEPVEK